MPIEPIPRLVKTNLRKNMLKLMSNDTPNIVADNHFVQVINTSPEYLGQNPESVLLIC